MTTEAVRIFISRLKRQDLPAYLTKPLQDVLTAALTGDAPGMATGNQAMKDIFSGIAAHKDFKQLAGADLGKQLARKIAEIPFLDEGSDAIVTLGLVFKAIVAADSPSAAADAAEQTVADFLDFIRIGFLPDIDSVTDDLMNEMGPRDIAVVLPMDIISEDASAADLALYPKQISDTIAQALRRPGRVLPFVKVNTMRGNHLELLKEAVNSGGCVGVKLYPSLGYDVDSPSMHQVLDFCNATSTPVLLHCNDGGFRRSVADADRCNPAHWRPLLQKFTRLNVCFGHFGGDGDLVKEYRAPRPLPAAKHLQGQRPARRLARHLGADRRTPALHRARASLLGAQQRCPLVSVQATHPSIPLAEGRVPPLPFPRDAAGAQQPAQGRGPLRSHWRAAGGRVGLSHHHPWQP